MKCIQTSCSFLPQRYVLCTFIVLGFLACYLMRTSTNMALNMMVKKVDKDNKTSTYCPAPKHEGKKATVNKDKFDWDEKMQHLVIALFYTGYIIGHVPSGVAADLLGGKHVYGGGIVLSAILSFLIPTMAKAHVLCFGLVRFLQGFSQGVMFPSASALVAKWAPPNERSIMTAIIQAGVHLGNSIGFIVWGFVLTVYRWEVAFYICGVIGLVWSVFWYTLCYSSPAKHPFISEKEKTMIESTISVSSKQKPKTIPWCSILTSLPFWSANLLNFGHSWAIFTMINELPMYTFKALNASIKGSGYLSAAPHLAMIPTAIGVGFLSDWLIKKGKTSRTFSRKLFSVIANIIPVPFLIGASYAGCDILLVIALLMVMMFFKGLIYGSIKANPVDLSPNFAGILMGLMNGTGACAAVLSLLISPLFIEGRKEDVEAWKGVFFLAASVMIVFTIPMIFFGSGEVQPWNNFPDESSTEPETTPAPSDQPGKTE